MRILLTGSHGYLGSVTSQTLLDAGHEIVGIDTLFYDGCDLWPADAPRFPFLALDIRDVEHDHLEGFDAVVHLAALSNDPVGALHPELTADINFRATVALARKAKEAGVARFVFASSCSMYGVAGDEELVDEEAALNPKTAYAESKVRAEEGLSELADPSFSPVFMRNATAYGLSPRLRVDIVLNNLVGWAHTTRKVLIMSDGTPWRPLVHVQDIARATVALLEAPRELVHDTAFNIGVDHENYRVRDLAEIARGVVTGCEIEYAGTAQAGVSYRVSFARFAHAFPEVRFEWTAKAGAQELVDAYRSAGLTLAGFESDVFTRVERLKRLLADGRLDDELRWRASAPAVAVGVSS